MSQKSNFAQQTNGKLSTTPNLIQDAQTISNHNDLTQHFVTNGPSNTQFAQPVFIPTSSGLILTAALPTVITQPLQQQQMPTLHQFNQDQMFVLQHHF